MTRFSELLIFLIPVSICWFWFNIDQNLTSLSIAKTNILLDMQYIQQYQIVLAWSFCMLISLVFIYGLWQLRSLFKLFKQGVFFSSQAAQHLYYFSITIFIIALLKPIVSGVLSVLLTMTNPVGKRLLVIEFTRNEFALIFIAGALLAITWILQEGRKLVEENAEFI